MQFRNDATSQGYQYILCLTDYLTKFCVLRPLKTQTAEEVAETFVKEIVLQFGPPTFLLSDRGANFLSDLFRSCCRLLKISRLHTTSYHPQCDGLTERTQKTCLSLLRSFLEDDRHQDWASFLPAIAYAYNCAIHSSTRCSPFFLLYGRRPRGLHEDFVSTPLYSDNPRFDQIFPRQMARVYRHVREQIAKAWVQQKKYRSPREAEVRLSVGDQVLLRRESFPLGHPRKLYDRWTGPFIIDEKIGDVNFRIRQLDGPTSQVVHADRLKKIPPCVFVWDHDQSLPIAPDQALDHDQSLPIAPDQALSSPTRSRPTSPLASSTPRLGPKTRSQGRATDHPLTMPRPLEYAARSPGRAADFSTLTTHPDSTPSVHTPVDLDTTTVSLGTDTFEDAIDTTPTTYHDAEA